MGLFQRHMFEYLLRDLFSWMIVFFVLLRFWWPHEGSPFLAKNSFKHFSSWESKGPTSSNATHPQKIRRLYQGSIEGNPVFPSLWRWFWVVAIWGALRPRPPTVKMEENKWCGRAVTKNWPWLCMLYIKGWTTIARYIGISHSLWANQDFMVHGMSGFLLRLPNWN